MEFHLLGPLEVLHDGERLALGGVRQRAVLGFLLLHANTPVTTRRLIDALWDDNEPATARKILQNAVSGLRRTLVAADDGQERAVPRSLPAREHGYVLHVPPHRLDLARYARLVERGRARLAAGAWEPAARLLQEALALWRGHALADLIEAGVTWPELTALEEGRWEVLSDKITAELMLGRLAEVTAELSVVTAAEPARERLCAQLMLALYQSGRQADALERYRRARSAVVEELGALPGRELRELERAILTQSPVIGSPGAAARLFARRAPGRAGAGGADVVARRAPAGRDRGFAPGRR
ncbi:BTAD domain-containing putative transcriptional regulator [Streptomyces sp. NPDC059853]|uniref:AfsR/SARP family transcriptional regulator n=1 Tax=Streptomyces sp. NPDC059853 TaxID=3346973 RepID=UPI00366099DF